MLQQLRSYIRKRNLLKPGERVGIAVSGGADSVALFRALLELRGELGIVLSVIHFHHGIRGEEADADAEFVSQLARKSGVPESSASGDVPFFAQKWGLSLEAAGRKLRYEFFTSLLELGGLDKVCTAHTRDDQAETVLMRLLRGSGTRGLAGIHPVVARSRGAIVRPMLTVSRRQVVEYLNSIGQDWREDSTNADTDFLRNKVRRELLPGLERDYNPNLRQVLEQMAEVARDEENYWENTLRQLAMEAVTKKPRSIEIRLGETVGEPAVLRRLIRFAAESLGLRLDFQHVEQVLELRDAPKSAEVELPGLWRARRTAGEWIVIEEALLNEMVNAGYEYELMVPGEVRLPSGGTTIRITFVPYERARELYNPASLLDAAKVKLPLCLRNWRPGDRLHPLHRGSEEKLKRLFQEAQIPAEQRGSWPVLTSDGTVVWAKGFPVAAHCAARDGCKRAILVESLEKIDRKSIRRK